MSDINEELDEFKKAYSVQEEGTVFDAANFGPVVIIQLTRIYDVLMALLANEDPEVASHLDMLHTAGKFLAPSPAFTEAQVTEK